MIFCLTTLVITAFIEHVWWRWMVLLKGKAASSNLMISAPTRFLSVYIRESKCVQASWDAAFRLRGTNILYLYLFHL